ncbi:hypothetical protein M0804_010744 [Polistes exclamans]|nr:hypothetical protein M0804_010744 [Polistes exclamans]
MYTQTQGERNYAPSMAQYSDATTLVRVMRRRSDFARRIASIVKPERRGEDSRGEQRRVDSTRVGSSRGNAIQCITPLS